MSIAIKEITERDLQAFQDFLKTERKPLLNLAYHHLPYPHCEIAVIKAVNSKATEKLKILADNLSLQLTEFPGEFITFSKYAPRKGSGGFSYIFSGYTLLNGKMIVGQTEVSCENIDVAELYEQYGEFSILTVNDNELRFFGDFFGMEPLYYYERDGVFAAANNYHLLLLLLQASDIELEMNIRRSRVNMITTGFTFGSPFSTDFDVKFCKQNLAHESMLYSAKDGLSIERSSLYDIVNKVEEWNENTYEDYIYKAKDEIYTNIKAVFEREQFKKVVIDVSGGFDSRIIFAAATNLQKKLRSKIATFSRYSGTTDDMEKAAAVTNLYNYPKMNYEDKDTSDIIIKNGEIGLAHLSRTLGTYSSLSYVYTRDFWEKKVIELTGYLGEVVFGFKRCRGELDYSLGDQRLLARLGGCYFYNNVSILQEVFSDQKQIINETLDKYNVDCLFKKFHLLYMDSRNRYICSSARNIEKDNFRIPIAFSRYSLKAKWLYFNKFYNNEVPDEKLSIDLTAAINPLLAALPFTADNDDVIPPKSNLLNPTNVNITPDFKYDRLPRVPENKDLYRLKVLEYMDNLEIAKQMLLHIYDYSAEYEPVLCCLYKVLRIFEENPTELKTSRGREQIRKLHDVYYQINFCKPKIK